MSVPPEPQSLAEPAPAPAPAKTVRRQPGRILPRPGARPSVRPRPANSTPPAARPTHAHVAHEEEKESFLQRHGALLGVAVLVIAGGTAFYFKKPSPPAAPVKPERIVMIAPLPPLPPPPKPLPPPPPQQKPPEEKMEKETAPEESKPVEKPQPAKAPEDPAPLGTGLKGDGPGMAGLGGGSGDGGGTGLGGSTGKSGSRFGWYAGQVQSKITEALRSHPKTRNASLRLEVRIWPDTTGRITRAALVGTSGDAAIDSAIQNGVLTGLQLQEPPPAGMKLPIVLRLTARRPN